MTTMDNPDVLVVGGGPAGIAAACAMADAGRTVLLCDQSNALGGVVHRRRDESEPAIRRPGDLQVLWSRMVKKLESNRRRIHVLLSSVFVGLDSSGVAVIRDQKLDKAIALTPRMVLFATGAYENIEPVPGWQLPGVMTAGALQVSLKTANAAPPGRILLAGGGPLLLAIASQLAKLGNPPIALLEEGDPLAELWRAASLPIGYLTEAMGYVSTLALKKVPWKRRSALIRINRTDDGLEAVIQTNGRTERMSADIIGLHNGLRPNNLGLTPENLDPSRGILVTHAGDCRETLGARAAPLSGALAAFRLLDAEGAKTPGSAPSLLQEERAQSSIESLFRNRSPRSLSKLPSDTVLCRCENQTAGDLRTLVASGAASFKEAKLIGRIGMGACQGRFCAELARRILADEFGVETSAADAGPPRWPIRPTSIKALATLSDFEPPISETPEMRE